MIARDAASGCMRLQVRLEERVLEVRAPMASVEAGDWVRWTGTHGRRAFYADAVEVLGRPSGAAQATDAGSARRRRRERERHALLRTLRQGFHDRGFAEVATPLLLDAPGQEPHLRPFETRWRGRPIWLATSPEYALKRLLADGSSRLFQLGPAFRDGPDEVSTLHQPEFTMLEWYRAFEGLDALARDLHWIGRDGCRAVSGGTVVERGGHRADLARAPVQVSVSDAFAELAGVDLEPYLDGAHAAFLSSLGGRALPGDDEADAADRSFFRALVESVEPRLGRGRPTLLTRFPARHAALAELAADDSRVAERFELYVVGVELANAFQELRDPVEQRRRLEAERASRHRREGVLLPLCEDFLGALEQGLPPCAGIALGVDRLLMLLSGATDIADVVSFPRRALDQGFQE